MTPSSGTSALPPFKFRPRRESVDWRRIGAVDVERLVSELDVDTLQEHVTAVTFCSVEGERCQRCQNPVDPALVKLFRLAQLTVEWLLHCQGYLALNLRAAEERLAAAGGDREQLLAQQKKQEEKLKALTAELKQRKKIIRNQQSMFGPRLITSQKVPLTRRTVTLYRRYLVTICVVWMHGRLADSPFDPAPLNPLWGPRLSVIFHSIYPQLPLAAVDIRDLFGWLFLGRNGQRAKPKSEIVFCNEMRVHYKRH